MNDPVAIDVEPTRPEAEGARKERRRRSSRRNAVEWVAVVIGALLVALLVKTFLVQAFYIPSTSMEPTLHVGDRVLVNKLSYRMHDVNRGDIVVFERPETSGETVRFDGCGGGTVEITRAPDLSADDIDDLIKRVVALPGETVEARDGRVFVNGEALDEPYLQPAVRTPNFQGFTCLRVPEGSVFVLGDNRQNSEASNRFGPIEDDAIIGRAFIRVWPLGDFGGL